MSDVPVPASADLALWLGACLRGGSPDRLGAAMGVHAPEHVLVTDEDVHRFPAAALGWLRGIGAAGAALALPVPGDPTGLAGPAAFNAAALEAGEAVVVSRAGVGLVPRRVGAAVEWRVWPAERPRPLDPVEEGRQLDRALLEAGERLAGLQVERWSDGHSEGRADEVGEALAALRDVPDLDWPDDLPARLRATATRALVCDRIVAVARRDTGGARSAWDMTRRDDELVALGRRARHALVAVCSWTP